MTKEVKDMAASIRAKLSNIAREEKRAFDSVLLLYMQERLLYRLSLSNYSEKFVLKGGLLMFVLTEFKGRPTKDIDFLAQQISNDMEHISRVFYEVCSCDCEDDGVNFDAESILVEEITKEANYQGVRVKINCLLGNAKKSIQLDIGFGDIVPKPQIMEYPVLLDMLPPKIKVYSMESVIAEKFQAMIVLSVANSRMKDFYDIYSLLSTQSFDGRKLQEAIWETLQRRHTVIEKENVIFSADFIQDEQRKKMWKGFLKKIGKNKPLEFDEIMKSITVFLKPIYDAILQEKEFFQEWYFSNQQWKNYN